MAVCAMLTALSVILTRFVPPISDTLRFTLGTIPIMFAGVVFGPVYGLIVGLLADVIGCLVNMMASSGGWLPGITICSGLLGGVIGLLYNVAFRKKQNFVTLAVSTAVTELLVSGGLKSLVLWQAYYGDTSFLAVFLPPRLLMSLVMVVVEIIVLKALLKATEKFFKKEKN